MPRIVITVTGNPRDQRITSTRLSQQDAESQLTEISEAIGQTTGTLTLPWCAIRKDAIIAAQMLPDPRAPRIA